MKFLHDLDQLHNSADRRRYGKYVLQEKHSAILDRSAQENDKVVDAEFQVVEAETAGLLQVKTAAEIVEATGTNTEAATEEATDTKTEAEIEEETHHNTEDQQKIPSAPSMIPEEYENSNDVELQSRIESTQ